MLKVYRIVQLLFEPRLLRSLVRLRYSGYLKEQGWFESIKSSIAVDEKNQPLPWVTYSFIDFIKPRLNQELRVFEYGSGNSTLFYAKYVKNVVAVEHDKKWYENLVDRLPTNAKVLYKKLEQGGEYCKASEQTRSEYDIIVVDGRDRVNCLLFATNAVTLNGVIVLDDSEREDYSEGVQYMKKAGFRQLDFWGIAPGLTYKKCTSVFYKDNNCLDI